MTDLAVEMFQFEDGLPAMSGVRRQWPRRAGRVTIDDHSPEGRAMV